MDAYLWIVRTVVLVTRPLRWVMTQPPARLALALFIVLSINSPRSTPAQQVPSDQPFQGLARVTVSAADAGPHIWEYQRDSSRVLVLGALFREPAELDYPRSTIEKAIAASGMVLGPPGVVIGDNLGMVRTLTLWPTVRKIKYLPDGKRLKDVLPPEMLKQWTALKGIYLDTDPDVDRMLPMYAGWKLFEAVLRKEGIEKRPSITRTVKRVAKAHEKEIIDARFRLAVNNPKAAVREFRVDPRADLACLESTIAGVELLPGVMRELAEAWSIGDVAAMGALLESQEIIPPCWSHLTDEAIALQQGVDLDEEIRLKWLASLEQAVANHSVVFTTAPIDSIMQRTGRAQWLLDAGYSLVDTFDDHQPRGPGEGQLSNE